MTPGQLHELTDALRIGGLVKCRCGASMLLQNDLVHDAIFAGCAAGCSPREVVLTMTEAIRADCPTTISDLVVARIRAIAGMDVENPVVRLPPFSTPDDQFFASIRVEEKRRGRRSS